MLCSADVLLGVGQMQMPRAEARPLTEAWSPDLATKQRAAHQHQPSAEVPQSGQGFKAQPFNRKILDAPVRLKAHIEIAPFMIMLYLYLCLEA